MLNVPLAIYFNSACGLEPIQGVERYSGKYLDGSFGIHMRGSVAVIPITSPLGDDSFYSAIFGFASVSSLARDIQKAIDNPEVKSILLHFNSPGGMVYGIHELSEQIYQSVNIKPILSYVSGMCCSAAYWLAAPTPIFVDETAIVGSIGIIQTFTKTSGDEIVVTSKNASNKNLNPEENDGLKAIQETLDALEEVFISDVAKYRNVSTKTVISEFGNGKVFVGRNGLHMVNGISSFEDVLKGMNMTGKSGEFQNAAAIAKAVTEKITKDQNQLNEFNGEVQSVAAVGTKPGIISESLIAGELVSLEDNSISLYNSERQRIEDIHNMFSMFKDEPPHYAVHYAILEVECMKDDKCSVDVARQKIIGLRQSFSSGNVVQGKVALSTEQLSTNKEEKDFETLVVALEEKGLSKIEAIKKITLEYPHLHKKFLEKVNQGGEVSRHGL